MDFSEQTFVIRYWPQMHSHFDYVGEWVERKQPDGESRYLRIMSYRDSLKWHTVESYHIPLTHYFKN